VNVTVVDPKNASIPVWMRIIVLSFIFRRKNYDVTVSWYAWVYGILGTPHIISRVVDANDLVTVNSVVRNNDVAAIFGGVVQLITIILLVLETG
jgi:hypothetical protein